MKISKKAITLLVMTTLLMSMIPIMPAQAITDPKIYTVENGVATDQVVLDSFYPEYLGEVVYGDTLAVKGTGVTAGHLVEIYFDSVGSWDGVTGFLNSSDANPDGSFEVWFDVPETVTGDHYIWVHDTATTSNIRAMTGQTEPLGALMVKPLLKISSTSGLAGYKPKLSVYGLGNEEEVTLLLTDIPTGVLTTSTVTTPAPVGTEYKFTLTDTPIVPGTTTFTVTSGTTGSTDFTDIPESNGVLVSTGTPTGTGTINYVTGEVSFDVGVDVTSITFVVDYYYYKVTPSDCYVFDVSVEATSLGTLIKTVTIPPDTAMIAGNYEIVVVHPDRPVTSIPYTIGAVISVDVDEGPSGTVVEITGKGFPPEHLIPIDAVTIINNDDTEIETCYILDRAADEATDSLGEFKIKVVIPIPEFGDWEDYDRLVVNLGTETAPLEDIITDFELTGIAGIEVTPGYGIQGATIVVEGWNFTAIEDKVVTIDLVEVVEAGVGTTQLIVEVETDSDGYFIETTQIPATTSGEYEIIASQDVYSIVAVDDLRIGMMIVILSPESGPTGTEVTMSGTGYTTGEPWNATFGDDTLFEALEVANTNLADENGDVPTFFVPTVDTGFYTISVLDTYADIAVEVEFEVTETTMILTDPVVAPADYKVTLEGYYFAEGVETANNGIDVVLYNSTEEWELDVKYDLDDDPDTLDPDLVLDLDLDWDDGYFEGYFTLPKDTEIDIGTYTMNVTDGEGLFAQLEFEVVPKTTTISTRKPTFKIGDTVAFDVESSFKQGDSYIKIYDPSDALYWQIDAFYDGDGEDKDLWLQVGTVVIVPYYQQTAGGNPLMLLDDAPLGTWKWIWYDADDDELDVGLFDVDPAPEDLMIGQIVDLNNEINELANQMTDVSDSFSAFETQLSDLETLSQQAITAAEQSAEAIQIVASTANQASQAADNAAESANAAMEAAKGLNTLVYGAIGASLVAALAAIVSLMQISKRIAG